MEPRRPDDFERANYYTGVAGTLLVRTSTYKYPKHRLARHCRYKHLSCRPHVRTSLCRRPRYCYFRRSRYQPSAYRNSRYAGYKSLKSHPYAPTSTHKCPKCVISRHGGCKRPELQPGEQASTCKCLAHCHSGTYNHLNRGPFVGTFPRRHKRPNRHHRRCRNHRRLISPGRLWKAFSTIGEHPILRIWSDEIVASIQKALDGLEWQAFYPIRIRVRRSDRTPRRNDLPTGELVLMVDVVPGKAD
jgi:hypothetical protein